jgi:hypothetical protein
VILCSDMSLDKTPRLVEQAERRDVRDAGFEPATPCV